jgi:hypothetical protein
MEMYLSDEGMQHVQHFLYRRLRIKAGTGMLKFVMHENLHALCECVRLLLQSHPLLLHVYRALLQGLVVPVATIPN